MNKFLIIFYTILLTKAEIVFGQETYKLLEPSLWGSETIEFESFVENAYIIFLSLCVLAAFIMIIYHGLSYMLSNVPFAKVNHKSKLAGAIGGLVLALSAWLILNTINPRLVGDINLNLGEVLIDSGSNNTNHPDTVTELNNFEDNPNNDQPGEVLSGSVEKVPNCHENPIPPQCSSLRDQGATVSGWYGTTGPRRTDRVHTDVAKATVWVQQKLREEHNLNTQVTAAHTNNVGHSAGSQHYQGIAVDLQPTSGSARTTANLQLIAQYCRKAGFTFTKVETTHTHCDAR